ncbi:NADH-dependent alcohol dehydrogenase [Psittacicella melopsittaci]|uniref:NADH-dependent alcohol dehydrogenase n=1 Tax=Psittacicella melopsittaci TaxID=2028576 RepID=A0A3A1Y1U5_9GAMM|nr:iron-containing alcohol dehydrogenase [Psittacicella melopsittaci]RIY31535.1 NADH-dependent alcohol dehydrogenase [Psittacicella melopsittaci]
MLNFEFYNPTRIIFGENTIARLDELVPAQAKVLVVYGGNSAKAFGTIGEVTKALGQRKYVEFGGVEANPDYLTLLKAVDAIKEHELDYILAVGGGSVIDGVKFIAAASQFAGEDKWAILEGAPISQALPFGVVLTIPATGSEMNSGAVISYRERGLKRSFASPLVFPKFSILDPSKTLTLPERQTMNGVVDSFVHIVEQYATKQTGAAVTDEFAEGLLRVLLQVGPELKANPNSVQARSDLMWAATNALNGLLRLGEVGDWSVHAIGHQLTALYGIDHARTLAIVLPGVWQYKLEAKQAKLAQMARKVFGLEGDDERELALATIAKTEEFFHSLGVGTRLSDYDLDVQAVVAVVANLEKIGATALGEDKDIDLVASTKILTSRL